MRCFFAKPTIHILCLIGVVINYSQRTDINLAMLSLLDYKLFEEGEVCRVQENRTVDQLTVNWNWYEYNGVIGAYYWTYFLPQMLSPFTVKSVDSKIITVVSMLLMSMCKICFPFALKLSAYPVIIFRCIEGFLSGIQIPAFDTMMRNWSAEGHEDIFGVSTTAMNLGLAIGHLAPAIILNFTLGSQACFVTAALGFCWCFIWLIFVYEKPEEHPFISAEEKMQIMSRLPKKHKNFTTSWMNIIGNRQIWCGIVANFGKVWMEYLTVLYCPLFNWSVHGVSSTVIGIRMGLAFFAGYILAIINSYGMRFLLRHTDIQLVVVRKICQFCCQGISPLILFAIVLWKCNSWVIIICWTIIILSFGFSTEGTMSIPGDTSPNFAGIIEGFMQSVQMIAAGILPFVAYNYLHQGNTHESWNRIFYCSSAIGLLTLVPFLIWGTAETASWDVPEKSVANIQERIEQREEMYVPDSRKKYSNVVISDIGSLSYSRSKSLRRFSKGARATIVEEDPAAIFQENRFKSKVRFSKLRSKSLIATNMQSRAGPSTSYGVEEESNQSSAESIDYEIQKLRKHQRRSSNNQT